MLMVIDIFEVATSRSALCKSAAKATIGNSSKLKNSFFIG
jgi:hypothetical protein